MGKIAMPIFAAGTVAAALPPLCAWAQGQSDAYKYGYGPHMMWSGGWFGMIVGPLIMILVLAVVIAAVVLIVRRVGGPWQGTAPPARKPIDILKERFARGEIDKEEFQERRSLLGD